MRKLIFSTIVVAVMSASASAAWFEGTVTAVTQFPDAQPGVEIDTSGDGVANAGGIMSGTADEIKTKTAILLTALAGGQTVRIFFDAQNKVTAVKINK